MRVSICTGAGGQGEGERTGEDHRTTALFSGQCDWQLWQQTNCCVCSFSVSYHGKFHLERLCASSGIGIGATKFTVDPDGGL